MLMADWANEKGMSFHPKEYFKEFKPTNGGQ